MATKLTPRPGARDPFLQTLNTVLSKGVRAQKDGSTDEDGGGLDVRFVFYDGQIEDPVSLPHPHTFSEGCYGISVHACTASDCIMS